MPKRVLHILGTAQLEGTGIARIVLTLARGIDPQKYTVEVCFMGETGPLVEQFQREGIPAQVIPWRHPHRDPLGLLSFWRMVSRERFDIIHAHWGGRAFRWTAKYAGKAKVIFHLHGRINESGGLQPIVVPTDNADLVIAVCNAVAAASKHKTTRVVYSGIEINEARDNNRCAERMIIGTAGRLLPIKGISSLLRAAAVLRADFPALQVEVAGEGPEAASLRSESSALGIDSSVKFLGWVPDTRVFFSGWQVYVQPSLEEGFPIAILEAMVSGLPVVASAVGGIREIVQDGITGKLVSPDEPAALAQCLRELLADPQGSSRMGEAGTERVRQCFSSQKMISEISTIYDELLDSADLSHDRRKSKQPANLAE